MLIVIEDKIWLIINDDIYIKECRLIKHGVQMLSLPTQNDMIADCSIALNIWIH